MSDIDYLYANAKLFNENNNWYKDAASSWNSLVKVYISPKKHIYANKSNNQLSLYWANVDGDQWRRPWKQMFHGSRILIGNSIWKEALRLHWNSKAKPNTLPKFMKINRVLNALAGMMHVRYDDPYMSKDMEDVSLQGN